MGVDVLVVADGLRQETGRWLASATEGSARDDAISKDVDAVAGSAEEEDEVFAALLVRPSGGGFSLQS